MTAGGFSGWQVVASWGLLKPYEGSEMQDIVGYRKPSYFDRLRRSLRGCRPQLSIDLCLFEEGFSLKLFGFFLPLPFLDRFAWEPHEIMESWGFTWHDRSLHLNWGRHFKILYAPWMYEQVAHEVQRPDGSWTRFVGSWEDKEPDSRWTESHPYHYLILPRGELQSRTATIHVERREYRWRWFRWLPWPRLVRHVLEVQFDDEVGERSGSWKGGTVECGYEMRPGETALETLRRMERERRLSV